ncbi:OmpA family protein [Sphingosinicellaceae bacterium]|nr:OmpA family protein [Sphingosinicellaceae bacterium]
MSTISKGPSAFLLVAMLTTSVPGILSAQQPAPEAELRATMPASPASRGPDIKGVISARSGDQMQVTAADGKKTIITINDSTRVKASTGLLGLGRSTLASTALLNGLPVAVKTMQAGDALVASQINFRNNDFKTATMIRTGTAQGFEEQTAATGALRGRMGDIDQYNIKGTTNVNFDTGKAQLSAEARANLCAAAATAEGMKNALILVVGYTDSTGPEEYNQQLSEKRASRVVNYIQQACHWKPYRMLTPTGMAEADPLASNDSVEGKAQNRRVAVNILVSKGLDGL